MKILKYTIIAIFMLIILLILGGFLFMNFNPEFGQSPKMTYEKSPNFKDGKFLLDVPISTRKDGLFRTLKKTFKKNPYSRPKKNIEVEKVDLNLFSQSKTKDVKIIWLGHSSFLFFFEGKTILIDPMFSQYTAPIHFDFLKRYSKELPFNIKELSNIDAVLYSHDHYDHLDYQSVLYLKDKVKNFYVPLGLGSHLKKWGVKQKQIQELDWWQGIKLDHLELISLPSQHFSGRGLFDRMKTLWSSWAVIGKNYKLYYSGDSGYSDHFKKIGEKFGKFDIALMECGQYDEDWKYIHMFPEQTVQASLDLKAKKTIPVHWGAFTLARNNWFDSIERFQKEAYKKGLEIITPKIGQIIFLNKSNFANHSWWNDYK